MSIHRSLKGNKWKEKRNVRTRRERIQTLIKEARYLKKIRSAYSLPKEKIVRLKIKKLKKKEEEKPITPIGYIPPSA
jgi:small basic protein (TIGR04137 family)